MINLIDGKDLFDAIKNLKPEEVLYVKAPEELKSGLNLSLDMMTTVQHLFEENAKAKDFNQEAVMSVMVSYKDAMSAYFNSIATFTLSLIGEEGILYCEDTSNHIDYNYNKTLGLISYKRNYCPNCHGSK